MNYSCLLLLFVPACLKAQTARDIIEAADAHMRGESSQASISIQTIRPAWRREMTVDTWVKGRDLSLILVRAPAREKGIVFLKRKKEVWNWLPALERSIKLPPSMMSQSWMGTDFTNDDLVKEASIVTDYEHRFIGDTTLMNRICYQIELLPKPGAAVVWGRLIVCIDKKDLLELHTRFFDEDGQLVNTMIAEEIKEMDGRLIPTRLVMIPKDKPGQKTIMIYHSIRYNRPIPDAFFSTEQMKKMKY